MFNIGDRVDKKEGTHFPGIVRTVYDDGNGKEFAIVRIPELKLQHLYPTEKLMKVDYTLKELLASLPDDEEGKRN